MATSFKRPLCALLHSVPQPCSRPPLTHASARDSWMLTGKSGSVSCGVTAPFSWVLVHKVLSVPSKSLSPQACVSSGGSMVGLIVTSSKRAYVTPRSAAPQSPYPCGSLLLTRTCAGDTQTQFCLSLCGVSGSWCTQSLSPLSISEHLLLGRKVMTNLDGILKNRDITLPTKVHLVKAMVFPVVMCGCESWTIKKAECRRIDAFELWCWRRLFESPLDCKEIKPVYFLKDISPEYSLEGLILQLKLQYFGHLMRRADSFEKTLMLGKIEGRRRR